MLTALASGLTLFDRESTDDSRVLTVASFAKIHLLSYEPLLQQFEAEHPGVKVKLELVESRALTQRVFSSFMSGVPGPDVVEIEITHIGRFFSGPLESIGFVDLTDRLHQSGLYDEFVPAKFQAWSNRGRIFGLPRDISPVALLYQPEAFAESGIDPQSIETWDDFYEAGKKLTRDLDGDGLIDQYAIELSDTISDDFHILLLQRGLDYFTPEYKPRLEEDIFIDTLAMYLKMAAGPDRIGAPLPNLVASAQAIRDRYIVSHLGADWRLGGFRMETPALAGLLRLMPLPAWEPGGRRTSTWGGTMMGICKSSPMQKEAWDFLKMIYTSREALLTTYRYTALTPPARFTWDAPEFDQPDPFIGGQKSGRFFIKLAPDVPARVKNPFSYMADQTMHQVIVRSCRRVHEEGYDRVRIIAAEELHRAAKHIEQRMERNPFL